MMFQKTFYLLKIRANLWGSLIKTVSLQSAHQVANVIRMIIKQLILQNDLGYHNSLMPGIILPNPTSFLWQPVLT